MAVMFKTEQGRVLVEPDYTIDEFDNVVGIVVLRGYELGGDGTVFHVNSKYVVEWWEHCQGVAPSRSEASS